MKKLRLITTSDAPSEDVGSAAAAAMEAESKSNSSNSSSGNSGSGGSGGAAAKASVVEVKGGGTATLFQGGAASAWDAAEADVAAGNA